MRNLRNSSVIGKSYNKLFFFMYWTERKNVDIMATETKEAGKTI